jgi:CubicO group peptidase (beta-lactamase class C family)
MESLAKTPNNDYHSDEVSETLNHSIHNNREGWYGWMGLGGSILQYNPEYKIGFGYVPTDLVFLDFGN